MVATVASVGRAELGHALQMLIDALVHTAFEHLDQRLAGSELETLVKRIRETP